MQTKYTVLGSYQHLIRRKDRGERAVFYAAQVGPLTREEANQLCIKLKNAGASCFIQRN
jgi:SPOR domain